MSLPDVSSLTIHDPGPRVPRIPADIEQSTDRYMVKLKHYCKALPYEVESNAKMQAMFDFIVLRLTQCLEAKDYDPGIQQWDSMLVYWMMLKYPITKEKRIQLAQVYFHVCTTPGMPTHIVSSCADTLQSLTKSKKKLSIEDMRLPWKPLYRILSKDLFLTRRQYEISQTSWYMGYITEAVRRFFHPAAIDEMLSVFTPMLDSTNLNSTLAAQYYLLTFLPQSHPQSYLPFLFRHWESLNSYMFDERMLQFLGRLAEMHLDPTVSDPRKIKEIPDDARSEDEDRPEWPKDDLESSFNWSGLYKDVGIFTDREWGVLMCKCLASMEIPLADAGSLTTGPNADNQASFEINRLPKPTWRIPSLAKIIVYSMAPDSIPSPGSTAPTPAFTPLASGASTPLPHLNGGPHNSLGDYLSASLGKAAFGKTNTYLAGSKALDSLVKLIASTEGFFHPSNSGSWTNDLSAFVKYIVYDFNKRWHEEQLPDCKTPKHRRLTSTMRRELVKSLRTVCFLAMFSQDSSTVNNIQTALRSMSLMEPDLILHPILERAVPALEALVETQRTIAVIRALGAVAPSMVCRHVYYPGAKHLIPILELLLPGIDLNDPLKTFCTTNFLIEVAQYMKFGELATPEQPQPIDSDTGLTVSEVPSMSVKLPDNISFEEQYSKDDEDALVVNMSQQFADWVAAFLRRVILLFENLPEEGANGAAGGQTEVTLVDAVCNAFSQICVHLSEPLYDMVLNMIFDYASTNVRANAIRAIHQLVECVANANPQKTLARFLPFCIQNIRNELEHGASSVRTTSLNSTPLPSDASLHWNLSILRGTMFTDGTAALKYRTELLDLFKFLHKKTLAKRGFSSAGKLLSSTLLTLTHTYPIENKFVNIDEWQSEEFRNNHHTYWGRLYSPEEVTPTWHVPNDDEIDFALQIFKELVEPALALIEDLLKPGVVRDSVWRNDFCRHLSLVRSAFSGTPTFVKEFISPEEAKAALETSDIRNEIPEMIAPVEPLAAGFTLSDPQDPRHQYMTDIKRRFGKLLYNASGALRSQGEENILDAVQMLIRSIRTYMLDYGDSRDNYYIQLDRYQQELSLSRQYANQKVWPRAVLLRRARLYHAARLRWNSVERRRGELEDNLIDEVIQWCLWHYATVRESSQSLLESLAGSYDGLRQRVLPALYDALKPGTEDDRMKGALWTLNTSVFAKYAVGDASLVPDFIQSFFACQHNEKPSIQGCVTALSETALSGFVEPNFVIYEIDNQHLIAAIRKLQATLPLRSDEALVQRCRAQRIERVGLWNDGIDRTTEHILQVAQSPQTHWKYSVLALRCLRTLIRRDAPMRPAHVKYLLNATLETHKEMRYYSQRAIMKVTRFIKMRTFSHGPCDMVLEQTHNPLKRKVTIPPDDRTHEFTSQWLADFKSPLDVRKAQREPILHDKIGSGWFAWRDTPAYLLPPDSTSPLLPWAEDYQPVVTVLREVVTQESFWKKLARHYSAENHSELMVQDNASNVKSLFQILEDEPFEALRPTLEGLLANTDKNKQRAAAEFVAGILAASKHWPREKQTKLWGWFKPYIKKVFGQTTNEMISIWTSFLEYTFYNRDPRRLQPLVDYLVEEFNQVDFNAESTSDVVKVLCFFRAFYEEMNWKFTAWADDVLRRCWPEIGSEHDDVLAYISEIMAFCGKIMRRPRFSAPSTEVVVRESRTASVNEDIMAVRGLYHEGRVLELVKRFKVWREERVPGVRAFQSTYDRVGTLVCRWLFQAIHDTNASSVFDYILPLMPELFRFTELNDNDDLAHRAKVLLNRMCGVMPPKPLLHPILDSIFTAIQTSPSWRVRLKILPLVQVYYFRQGPSISDIKVVEMLEVICRCLDDEVVEVREMAATTLTGILRVSPRRSVVQLKDRFVRLAKNSNLPDRRSPTYASTLRQRHAAILGVCALVESYPYTIERWMPELLTSVLAEHTYDPIPVSTTVRRCASNFRKTHQDTWHEDSKKFTEDQLAALSTLLTGSSYYA